MCLIICTTMNIKHDLRYVYSLLLATLALQLCYSQDVDLLYDGPELIRLVRNDSYIFYFSYDSVIYSIMPNNETLKDLRYFSKCCPPAFDYVPSERKCSKSNDINLYDKLGLDVNLIKSGLSNCDVIVDHLVPSDPEKWEVVLDAGILTYHGENFTLGKYCLDSVLNDDNLRILRVCYDSTYCTRERGISCLQKCCPDGEIFMNGSKPGEETCARNVKYGYNHTFMAFTGKFSLFHQKSACKISSENSVQSPTTDIEDNIKKYCFEYLKDDVSEDVALVLLECTLRQKLYTVDYCMMLSAVCLLVTIVVYCVVYKLEKVIHRVIFFFCLALIIAFSTSIKVRSGPDPERDDWGYVTYFGFFVTFAWLNVMCFDIWRTMSSMQGSVGDVRLENVKKTICYCLYAWLLPAALTSIYYYESKYLYMLDALNIDEKHGHKVYFVIPVGLLISINFVFFVLTLRYIIQVRNEINKIKDSNVEEKNKKTLLLSVNKKKISMASKLFVIMGINWSTEVITSFIEEKSAVVKTVIDVLDTFNSLQGFFVFVIFVLKRRVLVLFLKKLKQEDTKSYKHSSISSTTSTSV